jgi:hypothetical protein
LVRLAGNDAVTAIHWGMQDTAAASPAITPGNGSPSAFSSSEVPALAP